MIAHLEGREKNLEPFGLTGRRAEWIALACLHSGIFTRAQLCFHLGGNRWQALRFVRALIQQGLAAEETFEGRKVCRIFGRGIYRALGAEDIRHRRVASTEVLLRRLLSLDYVIEHAGLGWLPTEPEKVRAFQALGIRRRLLPVRVYRGAAGSTRRYFPQKLPIALDAKRALFVYADPGYETETALRSWGAAHRGLWEALRKQCRSIEAVAVVRERREGERAERVLGRWAENSGPAVSLEDSSIGREIAGIEQAILQGNAPVLDEHGGLQAALKRIVELKNLRRMPNHQAVIDGFAVWRSSRLPGGGF